MGIFRNTYETRSINGYNNEEFLRLLGINNLSVDKDRLGEITYYVCQKVLCESVAKLPLKLYKETNKGIEKAINHNLYNLLKLRPNPYMSSWNFWTTIEFYRNHYGNCMVYIDTAKSGRNAGKVRGLYILNNDAVTVWYDNANIFGSGSNALWYIYKDANGKEYKLSHDQVLHFRSSISLDGITGLAVQDILKTSIDNSMSGAKFVNSYFKQGLMAGGLLQYSGNLDDKAMKLMQDKFTSMASGIKNAGKVLPVPLGFTFQPINNKLVDSQFLELNKHTAQQISAAFGIKPSHLNEPQKYQNMELQGREFYDQTLLPILSGYEQELSYKLLTSSEREQGMFFKFSVDVILRASLKDRYESYAKAITNGLLTPNEAREMEDKPLHEDGDELIVNGTFIKLRDVGKQYNIPSEGGE